MSINILKCGQFPVIKEMQTKPQVTITTTRVKLKINSKGHKFVGQLELSPTTGESINWCNHFGKQLVIT